jgi:hypothetical protein
MRVVLNGGIRATSNGVGKTLVTNPAGDVDGSALFLATVTTECRSR